MSHMSDNKAGIWTTLICIVIQIPLWLLTSAASDYHDLVWGYPELFEPPYSPYIRPSFALAFGLSVTAVSWTIGSAFCACYVGNGHGRWYLFAGLLDAGLVSGFFTAAYFQSTFLPEPLGKCWNADIWPYNQTYKTSAPTFFEVLGGNTTAAEDHCSDLTFVWGMEICMGIVLSAMCLIAWTVAVRSFFFVPRNHPDHQSGPLGADLWRILGCLLQLFWFFVEPLIVRVFSGFRYWFRYREKKLQFSEQSKENAMDSFSKDTKHLVGQNQSFIVTIVELDNMSQIVHDRKRSTLEVVLSCYSPVLDSVLIGLHYVDIVNLGLVSKALCNALNTKSYEALRRASCVNGTESACWSCRKQICKDCKIAIPLKDPVTTQHLKTCELICSKCFYKTCCNGKFSRGGLKPRPTACSGHKSNGTTIRELCKNCFLVTPNGILAVRGNREQRELAQVSKASKNCGKCKKLVDATGPRWWICTSCHKECTERYHSAWRLSEDV